MVFGIFDFHHRLLSAVQLPEYPESPSLRRNLRRGYVFTPRTTKRFPRRYSTHPIAIRTIPARRQI
jgi:hypothetical protein